MAIDNLDLHAKATAVRAKLERAIASL